MMTASATSERGLATNASHVKVCKLTESFMNSVVFNREHNKRRERGGKLLHFYYHAILIQKHRCFFLVVLERNGSDEDGR